MLAAVSPNINSYDETFSSLIYAQRAGQIKTAAKVNIVAFQHTTAELNQMIQHYREENELLHAELKTAGVLRNGLVDNAQP